MAMEASSLIADYIVFLLFIGISTFFPLWSRAKGTPATKAAYVFAAGGKVSIAAMMLSIARGTLGVRSFLGFPSELFYRGSAMWETLYGMVCAYPIVAFIFVPVYYSLGITSVYQYLDLRFKSRLVRCIASATFIWRQLLNLGVTVFTPCVALNTVIGLPYWVSIVGITIIAIIFTLIGGLKAAIKADVIQGVTMILLSGAIIVQGCYESGGVGPVFNRTISDGRLKFFTSSLDPTVRVDTMSASLGQLFMSLSLIGCQQNFVQRFVSMSSEKKVKKTLMYNIPVITILFSMSWVVGMVIYSTYVDCDPLAAGYTKKMDEILPFFMEDKFVWLPGVLGLFMGSLFNGALSLSVSNLNSLATVTWEDFLSQAPAFKGMKDRQQLKIIKIVGAIYSVIIMGISFGVSYLSGVIEASMLVTSATSGQLLGVFLLAMLVPCCNSKGASVGMIVSHIVTLWMTTGYLTVGGGKPDVLLPTSIEGCTNDTFSSHITKPHLQWPILSPPLEVNLNTTNFLNTFNHIDVHHEAPHKNPLHGLYAITYMYYALIGTFITVFVGIAVSLVTGTDESDVYDEELLHPAVLKLSRMFPGMPRKYLPRDISKKMVPLDSKQKLEQNTKQESDNLGFEMRDGEFFDVELPKPCTDANPIHTISGAVSNGVSTSGSTRHFENYDASTRNDYRGDRRSFSIANSEDRTRFRRFSEEEIENS